MKKIAGFVLVAASAVLLSGCPGYGTHMGWGNHGSHMNNLRLEAYPSVPCSQVARSGPDGAPCRTSP